MYSLEQSIPKHVNVTFWQVKVLKNISHIQNNIKIKINCTPCISVTMLCYNSQVNVSYIQSKFMLLFKRIYLSLITSRDLSLSSLYDSITIGVRTHHSAARPTLVYSINPKSIPTKTC